MKKNKLIKNKCEIESCNIINQDLLELHHHVERTQINCTNNNFNIVILCCLHHKMIDTGELKIIAIYPSTKLPNMRTVIYELNGISNNPEITEPYFEFKAKTYKI